MKPKRTPPKSRDAILKRIIPAVGAIADHIDKLKNPAEAKAKLRLLAAAADVLEKVATSTDLERINAMAVTLEAWAEYSFRRGKGGAQ